MNIIIYKNKKAGGGGGEIISDQKKSHGHNKDLTRQLQRPPGMRANRSYINSTRGTSFRTLACQAKVTIGDSCLCWVDVTSFER